MKFNLDTLVNLLILSFLGVLAGTTKYLSAHSSKYTVKSYITAITGSILASITVGFAVLHSVNEIGFVISASLTAGYLGSKTLDLIVDWVVRVIEGRLGKFGGNDDTNSKFD